jgi:cytochrome c553
MNVATVPEGVTRLLGRGGAAMRPLHGWIALTLSMLVAFTPTPATGADRAAGRQLAEACVSCHGANGISVVPNAPNLAGQPEAYLADQLRQFRSGRRPSEVMAVIAKPLSDREIDDLAAWYAAIGIAATLPR